MRIGHPALGYVHVTLKVWRHGPQAREWRCLDCRKLWRWKNVYDAEGRCPACDGPTRRERCTCSKTGNSRHCEVHGPERRGSRGDLEARISGERGPHPPYEGTGVPRLRAAFERETGIEPPPHR